MALLLTGKELSECLPMEDAIAAVENALAERTAHTAVSPPRTRWSIPPSAMTLTPGGFQTMHVEGFRAYIKGEKQDQLTAVWDITDGRMEGLVVGPELGQIRTGAIGGVAMKWMAPAEAKTAAVVGGGPQSLAQLRALLVVRPKLQQIFVFRRDAERRIETTRLWGRELGVTVEPADSAREAVSQAQVVILATGSSTPVIEAGWLLSGAHLNSLGPKYRGQTEIGIDLLERADWLACDFPEQYRSEEEFIAQGTPLLSKLTDLAELVALHPVRKPELNTAFLSHGLAGTEVAVAHRALVNAEKMGKGTRLPDS